MARINNLTDFLTDVATAIKEKKGDSTNIPASQFDTEIANLPSQGTYQEKEITVTANGSQVITPDLDYDALTKVTVNTQVPASNLQTKMIRITDNGNISILPDSGYDGFREANLEVNVPTGGDTSDATAQAKDIILGKTAYTATGKTEGTFFGAQLFNDENAMKAAESDATTGDLACIYRYDYIPFTPSYDTKLPFTSYLPNQVTYETTITGTTIYAFINTDYIWDTIDTIGIRISPDKCEVGNIRIVSDYFEEETTITWRGTITTYNSIDGKTYTYADGEKEVIFGDGSSYGYMDFMLNDITRPFMNTRTAYYGGIYTYQGKNSMDELYAFTNITQSGYNKPTMDTTLVNIEDVTKCLKYIDANLEPDNYGNWLVCEKSDGTVYAFAEYVDNGNWHCADLFVNNGRVYIATHWSNSTPVRKYLLDLQNHTATYTTLTSTTTVVDNKAYITDISPTDKFYAWDKSSGSYAVSIRYQRSSSSTTYDNYTCENYIYHYYPAETQLTLKDPNELLPNVEGYGNGGVVTGDGSIYQNLDHRELFKIFWGKDNLTPDYTAHKNINTHQAATSFIGGHGLTEYVKTYDDITDGCHTGFIIPTDIDAQYSVVSPEYAYKTSTSDGIVSIKNRQTGEVTEVSIPGLVNAYSTSTRYYGNMISIWCKPSGSTSQRTVYNVNLATGTYTTQTLNYDGSYSSSYKYLYMSAMYKYKVYYMAIVQSSSTRTQFVSGYINMSTNAKVELVNTTLTMSSSFPHVSRGCTAITTKKQLAITFYTYTSSYYYDKYLYLYNLDTDARISSAHNTTGNDMYIYDYLSNSLMYQTLAVDDGTYLYFDYSYKIRKSNAEVSSGNPYRNILERSSPDLVHSYRIQTRVTEEGSDYSEHTLQLTELSTGSTITCYMPYERYYIPEGSDTASRQSLEAYVEEIDGEWYINEDLKFLTKLHRVEFADPTDYDWVLNCSVCSETYYVPQFFYTHNPDTIKEVTNGEN